MIAYVTGVLEMKKILGFVGRMTLHGIVLGIIWLDLSYVMINEWAAIALTIAWIAGVRVMERVVTDGRRKDAKDFGVSVTSGDKDEKHGKARTAKVRSGKIFFAVLDVVIVLVMIVATQFSPYWNSSVFRKNLTWEENGSKVFSKKDALTDYEFMMKYDLCDLTKSYTKITMSFMTYFDSYEAPFLLISANGNSEDVLTAVHEFGHYADGYTTFNADETIDLAEVFSQALEYISIDMLDDVLSQKTVKSILLSKILDSVSLYTQQASFAQFEKEIYALPEDELTAGTINDISLRLSKEFGYCMDGFESYYARSWIDINHFFEAPFYVISYPVSNDVALQIYGLEQESDGAGRAKSLEMLEHESGDLLETVEQYGLASPFEEDSVRNSAELIRDIVRKYEGIFLYPK